MNTLVVRRLIATLFVSQSLAALGVTAAYTVGAIAARHLSGSPALAGLPGTLFLLGSAGAAYPAGRFMDRFGRRNGLSLGFLVSLTGGLVGALGLILSDFSLLWWSAERWAG